MSVKIMRRLLGSIALLVAVATSGAQASDAGVAGTTAQNVGLAQFKMETPAGLRVTTFRIWLGRAPLASADDPAQIPGLTMIRPLEGRANGTAVVIAPGGGYVGLASSLEGVEPAAWFASRGIVAFVLTYRVRPAAQVTASLLDGARAIRFVRAHAAELKVDPNRIGLMGFSAGGHLAASTAAEATPGETDATDPVERVSSRPSFLILGYPWLEATKLDAKGSSDYCKFGAYIQPKRPCNAQDYTAYAPIDHVTKTMPATFIVHTTDDAVVPVMGSVRMYERLVQLGVDAELHVFASGPHGIGMGGGNGQALARWPDLLDQWLRAHKYIGG